MHPIGIKLFDQFLQKPRRSRPLISMTGCKPDDLHPGVNWPRSKKSSAAIKSKWPGLLVEAAQAVQLKKTTSLRICSGQ